MIDESKILYAQVPVKIRKGASIDSESIGTLKVGESVEVLEITPNWIHHSRGWSVRKFFAENVATVVEKSNTPPTLYPFNRQQTAKMQLLKSMRADADGGGTGGGGGTKPPSKPGGGIMDGIGNAANGLIDEGKKFLDETIPRKEDMLNSVGQLKDNLIQSGVDFGNQLKEDAIQGVTGAVTEIKDGVIQGAQNLVSSGISLVQSKLEGLVSNKISSLISGGQKSDLDFSTGLRGLWGLPYAFTDITDPIPGAITRTNGDGQSWFYGRVFSETFLSDMPILIITAGVPSFMTQASEEDRKTMFSIIAGATSSDDEKTQEQAVQNMSDGLEYFTFRESMIEYYGYVNFMCRGIASFLNLDEDSTFSEKFKNFFKDALFGADIQKRPSKIDWYDYPTREEIDQFAGKSVAPYIACYVDPNSSGGESLSNSTTQSMLAGINSLSDKTRDMGFMFAHVTGSDMAMYTNEVNEKLTKDFADIQMDSNFSQRFNTMISSSAAVLKNGGKMIFPDIWSDSNYQKSFSISAGFHSAYGDKMSIFLHVIVPFVHLFCLAAPRQLGVNGIMSPFLVRAYIKGEFCCTMGIVDSFSFKKGGQGDAWSLDGLPTSIEVDMSIVELYSSISISRVENIGDLLGVAGINYPLSNTMLIDFMANLTACDLNVNQFNRKVKLILIYMQAKLTDPVSDIPKKFLRNIRRFIGDFMRKLGLNNNLS